MTKATITFELGGRVDVKRLEGGITVFRRLITSLTVNMGVAWVVEDLQAGSAAITVRGEADDPAKVEQIVGEFGRIGKALEEHENLSHTNRVEKAANAVRNFAASVEYVRFGTPDADYMIYANGRTTSLPATTSALGAVAGRVQTLSNRAGLRFNLYDTVHDKAIGCYLTPGQEELMREAWGMRALVSGLVSRERATGRPIAIRQIGNVEILHDVAPGSYRQARGAVSWQEGDLLPEDTVRLLRDA